ncbi:iron ABC transporter permease [Salinibacterium sp. SYSU T00001]|uniref:FecCD family ABC transporter permease n=1 Tax=Homoserinimonas sedimenticola TaxID=2986805 RepID=UPI002235A3F9|nr:iron ABC transporter permease [Salinibacterium sedimenticola]MCW4385875.1 iron ABC transporter permease [Salinibacterium sedimenticola]
MAATGPVTGAAHPRKRSLTLAAVLGAALVGGVVLSAMVGQLPVTPQEVVGGILRGLGIETTWASDDPVIDATLWAVRFPRLVMGLVVGAALAVAGAVMQAIFGNPLAEPGVVGVSSGAALGAAAAIVFGLTALGGWAVALLAFLGGLLAVLLVYFVSRASGRTEVVTLLLTGIAINAFAGAGLALLMFLGDTSSREQIVFWQLGSMNGARWPEVGIVAVVALAGCAVALFLARRYDLLALGERAARHLGVDVELLRVVSIVLVALLTGVAVAFCGIIAFVGLVVPHIIRMAIGPAHRPLILASAIGGGVLLVFADVLARTLIAGADLPIGMLTSLVGGPFFFYLLYRARKQSGGWA